jgi:hypothetical protein
MDLFGTDRKRVKLDGTLPALRPCRSCGHTVGYHSDGAAQHAGGVRCDACDRHTGWLPKSYFDSAEEDAPLFE